MEKLKEEYQELLKKYNEAVELIKEERTLNLQLMETNRKVAAQNVEIATSYNKSENENKRMKAISKKGIFLEYNNDPGTMSFVPVLSDLSEFKNMRTKPSRLMYTFKFSDIEEWVTDLHNLMGKDDRKIHKVSEEDL